MSGTPQRQAAGNDEFNESVSRRGRADDYLLR